MTAPPTDPVAQAKGLKTVAVSLVLAGLLIGVGVPAALIIFEAQDAMTPLGFKIYWLASLVMMVLDFAVARWFWRRAIVLERSTQGLP
jgi:hypothetical protein